MYTITYLMLEGLEISVLHGDHQIGFRIASPAECSFKCPQQCSGFHVLVDSKEITQSC